MDKIVFVNEQAPALNATNLNLLQTYIENAINQAKSEAESEIPRETVLYNNETGSNDYITLASNVGNFDYIEIYFKRQSSNDYSSVKVYNADQKDVCLVIAEKWNNFEVYSSVVTINETLIQPKRAGGGFINTSSSTNTTNQIYITRVVGIKLGE